MQFKKLIVFLQLALLVCQASAQSSTTVESLLKEMSRDSLMEYLSSLTGAKSAQIPQGPVNILSRHKDDIGNVYAAEYLFKKLQDFGLKPIRQNFLQSGQNIFALKTGLKYPDRQIVICAHYDNMPPTTIAPGADDNGSGTVAVLEIARVLSKKYSDCSILFAFWDQEEQGLLGSKHYAGQASGRGDSIIAVINLDMIGYDSNNDGRVEIHTRNYSASGLLAQRVRALSSTFSIPLNAVVIDPGTPSSDHYSFWINNYSAVLLIEHATPDQYGFADFNKYYHSPQDDITIINQEYFFNTSRLALAAVATEAGISLEFPEPTLPITFHLAQNYPNPFNPTTTIEFDLPADNFVNLTVYDILGREVDVLINKFLRADWYSVTFDARNVNGGISSGVYFYLLRVGDFIRAKKMVLAK